jgi:hypothetical protein
MKNPSHDERISSFLDDALPAPERLAFEAELQDNGELQQQVAELRQLRADVALLPRYTATEDFAQRVVAAAVAAKADENANISPARRAQPVRFSRIARGVVIGMAVAASAAILMISLPWLNFDDKPVKLVATPNNNNTNVVSNQHTANAAENKPLAIVWSALPGNGDALVLRIRAPKEVAAGKVLNEALAAQGLERRRSGDTSTYAARASKLYRDQTKGVEGSPAAAALYLEISREDLEAALAALTKPEYKLEFVPGQMLALATTGAEGAAGEEPPPPAEFVQELHPRNFVLPSATTAAKHPTPPNHASAAGNVRVLILVEEIE